jgi:hypothetical protein
MSATFGSADRYYSTNRPDAPRDKQRRTLEERFAALLEKYDRELPQRVDRAFKQWNGILREYLRSETGLRLTVGEDTRAVPVRIRTGLPDPFAQILASVDEKEWLLLLNRSAIERAGHGLDFVQEEFDWLSSWEMVAPSPAKKDEVQNTAILFGVLGEVIRKLAILDKIRAIDQDTLGAYFFRLWRPEVHLYWMVIGFTAAMLGIPVEALTVVVTIHELGHAYTHLGRDIDGKRWETGAFAAADAGIVEGLAQFYTASICKKLYERFPPAWNAYTTLLENQSGPYRAHEEWLKDTKTGGEVVRMSMITCRSTGTETLNDFESLRKRYREELQKDRRTNVVADAKGSTGRQRP